MRRPITRLELLQLVIKQIALIANLKMAGSDPTRTFGQRYMANVMREQGEENLADLRAALAKCLK